MRIFNFLFHSFLFYSTTAHTSRTLFQYWVQYSENLNILIRMCLVALGNAEADRLAARGCVAPHLMTRFRPLPSSRIVASAVLPLSRPRPQRRSEVPLARGRSGRQLTPRRDPRLPPFDSRQPLSWRAFFRRLALIFRSLTPPALPVHDFNGDLVGD